MRTTLHTLRRPVHALGLAFRVAPHLVEVRDGTSSAPSNEMRPILGLWLFLATSFSSLVAHAEEPSGNEVIGNIDAQLGVGGGSVGIAGHVGVGGQAWMGDVVAVGVETGFVEDDQILGDKSSAWYVGPSVAVRTSRGGTYVLVTGGVGIASLTYRPGRLCIFTPCSSSLPSHSEDGVDVNLSAGVAFHLGPFEIGPMLRADSIVGDQMLTLNIALGLAATKSSE